MLFFPPVVDAFNISHVRTLKERFLREKKKKEEGKTQYFLDTSIYLAFYHFQNVRVN